MKNYQLSLSNMEILVGGQSGANERADASSSTLITGNRSIGGETDPISAAVQIDYLGGPITVYLYPEHSVIEFSEFVSFFG